MTRRSDASTQELTALRKRVAELEEELESTLAAARTAARPAPPRTADPAGEQRLQALLDIVPYPLFMKDRDRRYVLINKAVEGTFGCPAAEIVGKCVEEIHTAPPALRDAIRAGDEEVIASGGRVDWTPLTVELSDGSRRFEHVVKLPVRDEQGRIVGIAGVAREITAEVHAAEERDRQEALLRTVLSNAPTILWAIDAAGVITLSEGEGLRRQGMTPGENVGRRIFDVYADAPAFLADVRRALAGEAFDAPAATKGAIYHRWYRPVRDDEGRVTGVIGVSSDVTERERALEDLRASEARYRELTDTLPESLFEVGVDGRILYANPTALRTFGYEQADVAAGLEAFSLLRAEDRERASNEMARLVSGEHLGGREYIGLRKNGTTLPIIVHAVRIVRDGQADGVRGVVFDMTRPKQAELALRRVQRIDAIGQLAAGVAHDFNNVLQIVTGYAALVAESLPETADGTLREYMAKLLQACDSGSKLTKQLLTFGRQRDLEPQRIQLNAVITNTMQMVGRLIGEQIKLEVALADDLGVVDADPGALEQVLVNLCVNARDAMPAGGRLRIRTEAFEPTARFRALHAPRTDGAYAKLTVRDSGCGMTRDVIERIYEPFYSTKAAGRGNGLGLSIVHGIVRQHGGFIEVDSQPDQFSQFTIFLPLAKGDAGPAQPARDDGSSDADAARA